MGKTHYYSLYGKVILIIQSSSVEEPFIFLTCITKKSENEWERPSQGEGKTIKCNLEEIASIILVLRQKLLEWSNTHKFKDKETKISFKWESNTKWLKIGIGNYTKMLNYSQVELFKYLVKHLLQEKIMFQSSKKIKNKKVERLTEKKKEVSILTIILIKLKTRKRQMKFQKKRL